MSPDHDDKGNDGTDSHLWDFCRAVLWLLSISVSLLLFPENFLSPLTMIRFPAFSWRVPPNPEQR